MKMHGEFKTYHVNGQLQVHSNYVDGKEHGEYKQYDENGKLEAHVFYQHDKDITDQIEEMVDDINNITKEEKLAIKLKFGIECL